MVQAAEHRFSDDTVAVADPMVAGRWREPIVGWSGDARPETGVRPSPIVVSSPLCELWFAKTSRWKTRPEPHAPSRLCWTMVVRIIQIARLPAGSFDGISRTERRPPTLPMTRVIERLRFAANSMR